MSINTHTHTLVQWFTYTQSVDAHTSADSLTSQRAITSYEVLWFESGVLTAFTLDLLKCIVVTVTTCTHTSMDTEGLRHAQPINLLAQSHFFHLLKRGKTVSQVL